MYLTNPCAKRKVLSLTKPPIYKTKSLGHYITIAACVLRVSVCLSLSLSLSYTHTHTHTQLQLFQPFRGNKEGRYIFINKRIMISSLAKQKWFPERTFPYFTTCKLTIIYRPKPPVLSSHHHIALVARISLTLSRHSSLSFIALGRSSGQHPVSSHTC